MTMRISLFDKSRKHCGKRRKCWLPVFSPFPSVFHSLLLSPTTRRQILDSSKLKEFADDDFKFDENGRKLSKWVENNVGKGEFALYEQFLLFPQCFQKAFFPGASKGVVVWEWVKVVNSRDNSLPHNKNKDLFKLKAFADDNFNVAQMIKFFFERKVNIVGKGENAGYQHFLLFPQCFLTLSF